MKGDNKDFSKQLKNDLLKMSGVEPSIEVADKIVIRLLLLKLVAKYLTDKEINEQLEIADFIFKFDKYFEGDRGDIKELVNDYKKRIKTIRDDFTIEKSINGEWESK